MSIYSLQVHSSCDISNMEESRTRGDIHFQSLPHTGTGLKPFSGIVGHKRLNADKTIETNQIGNYWNVLKSILGCCVKLCFEEEKTKTKRNVTRQNSQWLQYFLRYSTPIPINWWYSGDILLLLLTGDGNWRGLELLERVGRCSLDYHTNGNGSKNSAVLQKAKRLRQRTLLLQASSQIRPMSSFSQVFKILCFFCDHCQSLPCIAMAKYLSQAKVHFS